MEKNMVVYNAGTRELTAKIVYYGPGLGGKTTNLQVLHDRLDPATVGKLLNLATQTDRTIYFDLLPVELGDIKGYKIRFQLATVPGQTAFNETRRVVLKGADGIVFVADSQWTMLPKNLESWHNLKENLKANGVSFEGIPIVIQYNKRDLTDILSVDALQEALGLSSYPFVEAVASAGRGVTETFKLISKLTFVDLLRRLQGRRPEEAPPVAPRKDRDDLLSWKDSLLNRAVPPAAKRPLSLVPPTANTEEAPFEAAEDAPVPEALAEAEGPFTEASTPEPQPEAAPAAPPLAKAPDRPTERIEYVDPLEAARLAAPLFPSKPAPPAAPMTPVAPTPPAAPSAASSAPVPPPAPAIPRKPAPLSPDQTQALQPQVVEALRELSLPAVAKEIPPRRVPAPAAPAPPVPAPAIDDAKVQGLETRLARAEEALSRERADRSRAEEAAAELETRLEAMERSERDLGRSLTERQDGLSQRLETLEKASLLRQKETEPRLRAVEERLDRGEKRQRTAEDDVSLALRTLSERGEKLHQQIEDIAEQIVALDRSLQDKTSQTRRESDDIRAQFDALQMVLEEKTKQGRREAEDIRLQLAPLLEAQGKGSQTHEHLLTEFDRLRESLADAMGDLSERLRNAMKGL
ncbi:MAG TPA: ADP-ribosylation factor-like protein [Thermoanaerobaculia bacterium]|jgi:signal recognition particle receptor subunit beta/predicted  nucleic acid-binding Zn-ribbon protein|nr:ADP-ribosylation factor-like protein [Thermoanaerobaculia bacterium]